MTANTQVDGAISVLSAAQVLATPSTVAFDFGTVNDIDLRDFGNPGDRVLIVVSANRASGTTSTLQVVVQDAPDSSGSIGTPATATVTGSNAVIAAGDAGLSVRKLGLVIKAGRPWLRLSLTHASGTDSFQAHANVLLIPKSL